MSNYQVLFNGVITEGCDQAQVERSLAVELGIDPAKARRLFNGRTVVLASQLSRDEALDLQQRLEQADAICRIKDMTPKADAPLDWESERSDATLRDLTAAHIECPRCGHMQLESSHCARCGVDLEAMARKKRKEDLLLEKRLREHRAARQQAGSTEPAEALPGPLAADPADAPPAKSGLFSRLFKRSA